MLIHQPKIVSYFGVTGRQREFENVQGQVGVFHAYCFGHCSYQFHLLPWTSFYIQVTGDILLEF